MKDIVLLEGQDKMNKIELSSSENSQKDLIDIDDAGVQ